MTKKTWLRRQPARLRARRETGHETGSASGQDAVRERFERALAIERLERGLPTVIDLTTSDEDADASP